MDQKNRQLRTGLFSDIVATNDDPTENVNTVTNVVFVMKEGVVYKAITTNAFQFK
jgi:imidazolonepropionase-like amidohydrolase